MLIVQSLLGAISLAVIHLLANRLRFLHGTPRSRWLSIAGGVSVTYAIVHLLPELQGHQQVLKRTATNNGVAFAQEHLVWLLTLLGLIVFYGLEKAALGKKSGSRYPSGVFWLHIASFAVYNALLGYLLVREDRGPTSLALFVIGVGLHFVVNDFGLQQHHQAQYRRLGRWVLSAAILLGWAVGICTQIHEAVTAAVAAFLAGGILLNAFKEELPEEKESRFWAFAFGASAYAAVLLVI